MRRLSPKKKAAAQAGKEAANSPSSAKNNNKSPPKKRAQADLNNDGESEKEEATFEVDSIVASRIIRGQQQFKVHWKGYPSSNDTWEFESNLNCDSLLKKYLAEQEESQESDSKKNGQAKRKRGRPSKKSKSDKNGKADDSEEEEDEKDVKKEKDEKDAEEEDEEVEASTSNNSAAAASPKRGRKKARFEDSEASPPTTEKKKKKKQEVDEEESEDGEASPPATEKKKKKKKVDEDEEFEVEKIIDCVMDQGKRFFLVRWKGYGKDSDTWEPQSHLGSSQDLVDEYLISHPIDEEREDGKKTRVNPRKTSGYAVGPTGKRQSRRAHGRVRATYFDQE